MKGNCCRKGYSDLFINLLLDKGLKLNEVASVSQNYLFNYPANWLKLSKLRMDDGGHVVKAAYLNDEKPVDEFAAPASWHFKGSLSDE